MTTIYLIRHAEAEGNLYRRIQGITDGKITIRGQKQIECLAERFKNIPIDAIYSSDLSRTQTTAGAILKYHDLKLNIEPRLREINMGSWEDLPWGNVQYDDDLMLKMFSNDPAKWQTNGSESFEHIQKRMSEVLLELAKKHDGQTIACFSHGMVIRCLIALIKSIKSDDISAIKHGDNTCVAKLFVDNGKFEIEYYNDNSHLNEKVSTFANQVWWKEEEKPDFTNLRLLPMDVKKDKKLYSESYGDAWESSYGTLAGYSEKAYLSGALRSSQKDENTVIKAYYNDDYAGIIELETDRMASEGAGWIKFLYLVPKYRGRNFGVQLLGHAVSYYRALGRKSLRLHVAEVNTHGIKFYEHYGFKRILTEKGRFSDIWLMELSI